MRTRATLLSLMLLLQAVPASAQQVDVTASVPTRSPTGSGTRNLTFGVLTPIAGTTQAINVVAAPAPVSATVQSGEFRYDVAGLRGVTFNVTVPAQLTGPGATPLNVSFDGNQYGGYCVSTTAACTLTGFNPAGGQNVRVCRNTFFIWCNPFTPYDGGSIMRVYVGGNLSVPPTARAGIYTGTLTLTIVQVH